MKNTAAAMRAFVRKEKLRPFTIELGSPVDQLLDRVWTFLDEHSNCLAIAKAGSGIQGVLFVEVDLVIIAEGRGDAALGILRRGLAQAVLGDNQYGTRPGKLNGSPQSGHAGTHHEIIPADRICLNVLGLCVDSNHGTPEPFLGRHAEGAWYKWYVPTYQVNAGARQYDCVVERGAIALAGEHISKRTGKVFVLTTADVWQLYGANLRKGLGSHPFEVLLFPGGEVNKRLSEVERLAEQMMEAGADRSSFVVAFGGGIVTDLGGFLAAIFMRGIPVLQVPTTLLAQVDAAVGGKTGANLIAGKNLIGSFHQPAAVLIDPEVLRSLPEREYRAGLFEVVKHGIIASTDLFRLLSERSQDVLSQDPDVVETIISESVRIKAGVVSADERESGLRRILNFGHTIGHALEAETRYSRFLHGEAVAFGMNAATYLARLAGLLSSADCDAILRVISLYGPIPSLDGIRAENLLARTAKDKKTIQGNVHFVLPDRIGHVQIRSDIAESDVLAATRAALA
jgi:3-dehydroquinate synthase